MKKILLISHNEICYNARLLKAADTLCASGYEVHVFNPVTGIAPQQVYEKIKRNRKWKIIENDISRRTPSSKVKWLINGLLFKTVRMLRDKFGVKFWDSYYLNKGLILAPQLDSVKYDWIMIHLIDNLPFAVTLKNKMGSKLLFDSQEYFVGQYKGFSKAQYNWVVEKQNKFIKDVDILLATTDVMKRRLISDYQLKIPVLRVRNMPTQAQQHLPAENEPKERVGPLKLVWHGMAIFFNNRRGVHVLLSAVAQCHENVQLTLQGNFPESQKVIFEQYKKELNLEGKVTIMPAAEPDEIVNSLFSYDVGLTGEIPNEDNQRLTSSNKLFDYINAGLAVISADTPGLAETIDEYQVGCKYEPGNAQQLSLIIDAFARNPQRLDKYKRNARTAAEVLYWENDYLSVLERLKDGLH